MGFQQPGADEAGQHALHVQPLGGGHEVEESLLQGHVDTGQLDDVVHTPSSWTEEKG